MITHVSEFQFESPILKPETPINVAVIGNEADYNEYFFFCHPFDCILEFYGMDKFMNMLWFNMAICILLKPQWYITAVLWLKKNYTFGLGLTFCNASLPVPLRNSTGQME